jgi:hypothetical protein
MPALAELARISRDDDVPMPPADPRTDMATAARYVWDRCRRLAEEDGTPEDRDEIPGYRWEGGIADVIRLLWPDLNDRTANYVRAQVGKLLDNAGNMILLQGGSRPVRWISAQWPTTQDAQPTGDLARQPPASADPIIDITETSPASDFHDQMVADLVADTGRKDTEIADLKATVARLESNLAAVRSYLTTVASMIQ